MKKHTPYKYCIFYMEREYCDRINQELKEKGYDNIKSIIPRVNILKRTVKGRMIFEEVPVLFDYGFIRIPTHLAYSRPFLNRLKRDISGIRSWLKDTETLHQRKKKVRIDNAEDFDDFSLVATCSRKDVRRFIRLARYNKRFSVEDLVNVKIGDYIVLRGYPYEGVDATVLEVDYLCKRVKVLVYPEMGKMEIWLPFDTVIYSVYHDYDTDRLYANKLDYFPENITEDRINRILDLKRKV